MDPLGNNKIYAAILGAGLVFMMIRTLPEVLMHEDTPYVPAYIPAGTTIGGDAEEEIELPFPQADWVAAMDAERGARVFKNCTSCHSLEQGGPNGTGPGLWNVVGATKGTHAGFAYSEAMASAGTSWTYEELDGFLEAPKRWLPGTKMNFIGIRKESDRAAVIEYMRLAHDNPPPQPTPAPAEIELTAEVEDAADIPNEVDVQDPTLDLSETDGDNLSDQGNAEIIDQPESTGNEDDGETVVEDLIDTVEDAVDGDDQADDQD
ncbi:MAG: cytochrome c family protein [Litorimonas sp.]